jgi:hypothetical protein
LHGRENCRLGARESSVLNERNGDEGVIQAVFEIIEPTSRYAIEFGAVDGIQDCNIRNLIINEGWGGLLIEGYEPEAKRLSENYMDIPRVTTLQAWVYPGNVEILFEESGVPRDVDLLIIDIDSNDYYVWRAIRDYRPKLVMIEYNPSFPPPQRAVVEPNARMAGFSRVSAEKLRLARPSSREGQRRHAHRSRGPLLARTR